MLSAIAFLPPEHRQLFQGRDFAQLVDHIQVHEIRNAHEVLSMHNSQDLKPSSVAESQDAWIRRHAPLFVRS